ncbi:MAG: arsenate reductase [Lentisphaeria bacterium]|jgi:arsenate reductase
MTTLYGIKNCDTVKKARTWLDQNLCEFTFHDFRADALTTADFESWESAIGAERLINRRSTTWKQLDEEQKTKFNTTPLTAQAKAIVLQKPTLLKRPILKHKNHIYAGFNAGEYNTIFFN